MKKMLIVCGFLVALTVGGCGGEKNDNPIGPEPSPPPPPAQANVVITSVTATGEKKEGGGYRYSVVVTLRELDGGRAELNAWDFTFLNGSARFMQSRFERSQILPAFLSLAGHEVKVGRFNIEYTDPYATNVALSLTYSGANGTSRTVSATGSVSPLPLPPPPEYRVSGRVRDQQTRRTISATVSLISNGTVVRFVISGEDGVYILSVPAGRYTLRIEAPGHSTTDREITVSNRDVEVGDVIVPPTSSEGGGGGGGGGESGGGTSRIPPPVEVGRNSDNRVTLRVANNTPYSIRVSLSGPLSQTVTLSRGATQALDLTPGGTFRETVSAVNVPPGIIIQPFSGSFTLRRGSIYEQWFFIE